MQRFYGIGKVWKKLKKKKKFIKINFEKTPTQYMISVTMQISEFEHAIPGAGEWLWLFGEVKTPQF